MNAPLAADYLSLVRSCSTQNQVNRLHIEIETGSTPTELAEIAALARNSDLPPRSHAWLQKVATMCPEVLTSPRHFARTRLAERVALYEPPTGNAAERGLLIAFCGIARRLMLPLPYFLQSLPCGGWDVLLLQRLPSVSYLSGLEGVAADLPGVVRYLRRAIAGRDYRRTVVLGTSGGAYAAVLAALLMEADRGVSVGGNLPAAGSEPAAAARRVLEQLQTGAASPELCYVFGAGFQRDASAAAVLREIHGGLVLPIPGVDIHGVFAPLLKRGQLPDFLESILEGPLSAWLAPSSEAGMLGSGP